MSTYAPAMTYGGAVVAPALTPGITAPPGKTEVAPPPVKEPKVDIQSRLTVTLPAEAKLYIDGQLMKSTSGSRTFRTPTLNPGQTYFYDVKVEMVRDGETVSDTQRVIIRPGQNAQVAFTNLDKADTATARAANSGR